MNEAKTAALNLTVVRRGGAGFLPVGLGFAHPDGGWRARCWATPGAGRVGVFLPAGVSGELPERLEVRDAFGTRLGSGVFVPGLRGVMLRVNAWPVLREGGCWVRLVIPDGAASVRLDAGRGRSGG